MKASSSAGAQECIHLMPHGGLVVVQAIAHALTLAGVAEDLDSDPARMRRRYPEARSAIEARMLDALSGPRAREPSTCCSTSRGAGNCTKRANFQSLTNGSRRP